MNSKKGQVTLFVILGLILVIVAGLFFYNKSELVDEFQEKQLENVKEVDSKLKPVQTYVEQCMHQVTADGLRKIAENGGYLEPMEERRFSYDPIDILDNDGIMFMEDYFIPYWSYSTNEINDYGFVQELRIPSIEDIEFRATKYVEENLLDCLDNLTTLEYDSDLEILDVPEIQLVITEDKVKIRNDMDVLVKENNRKISEYYVELNVPFKRYFDTAVALANTHQKYQFVENLILSLIGYYGDLNAAKLPPFYATSEGYDYVMWNQNDVQNKLSLMMQSYIQMIRILGSDNSLELDLSQTSDAESILFLGTQTRIMNPDAIKDAEISFIYNKFPMYSKVNCKKCTSALVEPFRTEITSPVGSKQIEYEYDFYYDITMPILVEMKFDSVDGIEDPFVFIMGLETNIRKNLKSQDYLDNKGPLPWNENMLKEKLIPLEGSDAGKEVEFDETPQATKKLFGNEAQKISGNLTVKIYDAKTLEEIEGALIDLGIEGYSSANLGVTEKDERGDIQFVGPAPVVYNGFISAEKKGYFKQYKLITTNIGEEQLIIFELEPETVKNFTIQVFDLNDMKIRPLGQREEVTLFFNKINDGNTLNKHQEAVRFTNSSRIDEGKIMPGYFTVNAMFIDNEGFVIPKECKSYCTNEIAGICFSSEKVPKDDIEVIPSMWGGVEFNSENPLLITENDLYDNNTIMLTVLKLRTPRCIGDLEIIGDLDKYTVLFESKLKPLFIKNESTN